MPRTLAKLAGNPLSLIGAAVATASGVIFLTLFALGLFGYDGGPYIGLFAFVVLPTLLAFGLLLIPWGLARRRRAEARRPGTPAFPIVDLNRASTRWTVLGVLALTAVNVIVLATATHEGIEVMSSNSFCGAACHPVMEPENTAFVQSAHAGIRCVDCHVGSGTGAFVDAKLNGTVQLVHALTDRVPRPIPAPVETLRAAEDTCGTCHRWDRWLGDRLRIVRRFEADESNTALTSVLLMHAGGWRNGESEGIHWHADPRNRVRYRSTADRSTVYEIEVTRSDGSSATYFRPGADPESADEPPTVWRTMDCVDCHNRTGHRFADPEAAVDRALAEGDLPDDLPFLKRQAMRALTADGPSAAAELTAFYSRFYPEVAAERRQELTAAGELLATLRSRNLFPAMQVAWGTYPDHRGHTSSPGCFRCHDDELETAGGDYLAQDCYSCHNLLAADEEEPEILATLEG